MKTCTKCQKSKPHTKRYFHRKSSSTKTLRSLCKVCANKAAKISNAKLHEQRLKPLPKWIIQVDRSIVELKHIERVLPAYPQKDSEYHKAMERIDRNPQFFISLCKGLI